MYSHIDEQVYTVDYPDVETKTALFYAHCYQRAVSRSSAVSQPAFSPCNSPELPRVVTISADDVGGAGSEPSPPAFPHFRSGLSNARTTRLSFYSLGLENFPSCIALKRRSPIQGHLRTKEKPLETESWRKKRRSAD